MGQVKGYKQTRIASTSANIATGAGIKLDDGNYAYGYWSIRNMRSRHISHRNKIKFEFDARPSTNLVYDNVGSTGVSGSYDTTTDTHIYIQSIIIYDSTGATTHMNLNFAEIHGVGGCIERGWIGSDEDNYDPQSDYPRFNISNEKYLFQPCNFWIDLDKLALETTMSSRNNVFSYVDQPDGMQILLYLYQNPGSVEGTDDEEGDSTFAKITEYRQAFSPMNLEKPKEDYTPRYFNRYYATGGGNTYGTEYDYITFSEPKEIKKLQRGNFNIWLGTSPVTGITPDGATTEHTQISYANGNWDLEVSLDEGVTFSAFESEATYTFGLDTTMQFADTNCIWFHDEVLISDWDDTTIANTNNCYLGDMVFRYGPSEFAHDSTVTADYFYIIKDNLEDKTDATIT